MYIWAVLSLCSVALAAPMDVDSRASRFSASKTWDFTNLNAVPSDLWISTDLIGNGGAPLKHKFDKKNVKVQDGFLQLTIPGGQTGDTLSSAEVSTVFKLKYASVTTYAILTDTPGACNGMFFYKSDSQETDIEWISDPQSHSNLNSPNGTRAMQYTNQATSGNTDDATMVYGPAPADAVSAVHAYRIDWTAKSTKYYLDGVLQHTMKKNVPSESGSWLWNNWGNGDPYWTGPAPKSDAIFKIQKIVMHYNPADEY